MRPLALLLLVASGLAVAQPPTDPSATVAPAAAASAPPAPDATPAPLPAPPYAKPLRDQARKILKGPDFHRESQDRRLVMRDWLQRWLKSEPRKKKADAGEPFNLTALAQVIKVLLIILLGLGLMWLLWRGWKWLSPYAAKRPQEPGRPVLEAQSLLLTGSALPDHVSAAARSAWQRGDAVLALSLLYRGAVRSLAEQHRVELPDSATEGECLRLARRSGKAVVSEGFAPIVRAWMALAYARRAPDDFEQLLQVYCRCFESAGGRA
jgi:hypothetical protein